MLRINNVFGRKGHRFARGLIILQDITGNGRHIESLGYGQVRCSGVQMEHRPDGFGPHGLQRLGDQNLGFQVQKYPADTGQHDVRGPILGGNAEQTELKRQQVRLFPGLPNIGVHALNKGGDDLFPVRVIIPVLLIQIAAKAQQPGTDVAVQGLGTLNLGHRAGDAPTPDFKLKQAVAGRVIALGKKQVVLVCGIDVGNTPTVGQDFDRLAEPGDAQCFHSILLNASLGHDRGSTQGRRETGDDTQAESKQSLCNRQHSRSV